MVMSSGFSFVSAHIDVRVDIREVDGSAGWHVVLWVV